jgi:ribonuclease-3
MAVTETILDYFKTDVKVKEFRKAVERIIGEKPKNDSLYQLAFRHTSASKTSTVKGFKVLGMIVAEYLFKKYPFKDEGFLTEIRSRIVNRESLNQVARKIGLDDLITFDGNRVTHARTSMYGDAMEALIGAIYLDKGFRFTKNFIVKSLMANYFDLDEVIKNNANYKSILLTWSQSLGKNVEFEIIKENGKHHSKEFVAQIKVDDEIVSEGRGWNKKKAEQDAARKACETLEIND